MMYKFNWQEQVCFERMNRRLFLENINCKDFRKTGGWRRSWGEKIQVWIKLCQKSGNQKINGINCSLSPQSLVWLLTSPRINDGAAITIICCTNIHLSNTPWRSLYSSPVIIINSSPFASVARVSAAAACSALTLTRWAGRRGAAGRSHSSWEHTSPPWPRSLK